MLGRARVPEDPRILIQSRKGFGDTYGVRGQKGTLTKPVGE